MTNSTKPINPIKTRDKLAKIAGVGQDTYYKWKRILDSDNEEIKDKLKNKSRAVKTLLLINSYFYLLFLYLIKNNLRIFTMYCTN